MAARHVVLRHRGHGGHGGHRGSRRAAVAVIAAAALVAGVGPLSPTAASAADAPQETVVPAALRSTYTGASLYTTNTQSGTDGAGSQGVFHSLEGFSGVVWTRYSSGESVPVPTRYGRSGIPTGSDVLAYTDSGRVELWDASDGTIRTIEVPQGQFLYGVYGTTVVSRQNTLAEDGTTVVVMHLLTLAPDGTIRDVPVHGVPAGMQFVGARGSDATGILFAARLGGTSRLVAVDRETGQVQGWTQPLPTGYIRAKMSAHHIVVYGDSDPTVLVLPRSDVSATPVGVRLESGFAAPGQELALVGDWLVYRPGPALVLLAKPIAGGDSVVVIAASNTGLSSAPDGSALVVGRSSAALDDLGIQRIHSGADGVPTVTTVKPLPRPPRKISGLSLSQGRLIDVGDVGLAGGDRDAYVRDVTVTGTGTPAYGERIAFTSRDIVMDDCPAADSACAPVFDVGDGRIAWLERTDTGTDLLRVNGPGAYDFFGDGVPGGGAITDVSGTYVVYTSAGRQSVYRVDDYAAPMTRTPSAAAVWGDRLWTPGVTTGSVSALDLVSRKTVETVSTGAGCVPQELQADGRWLYWRCAGGGPAGVYDRTAKKSVTVPPGEALLGDGYVVTHDKQAGKLSLTTVDSGRAATRVIGELPDTGVSQRHVRWTVDKYGGHAAYVDAQERVHLVPAGVTTTQPLTTLREQKAATVNAEWKQDRPGMRGTAVFDGVFSKPVASWTLVVRDKNTGRVVDQRRGGETRGRLDVQWTGMDPARQYKAPLPNGQYTWELTANPADGQGAALRRGGTVRLYLGLPVRRDHSGAGAQPDAVADLLTLGAGGTFSFQLGNGAGTFPARVSGSGWPTSVVAVPFGDVNNDKCNDVLVRMANGSLRAYRPACGAPLTPSTRYVTMSGGTGWTAYNVLTAPGDLTGDGRTDLVARKSSTGDLYLFAALSDGNLAAGKRIGSGWTSYTKIVGAGDLDGDGFGDVLARYKDGTLYRYGGTGTGGLKSPVKLFAYWGASFDAVVGAGDITADGKADLVARDTWGNLWRQNGDGKGSFGPLTKIATGWGSYKGLF